MGIPCSSSCGWREIRKVRDEISRLQKITWLLLLGLLPAVSEAVAQGPWIFYTDLTSGPHAGGENNNGAIVTVYGARFGAQQGTSTLTVGTATVASYLLWSDVKIAVAIGPAATTGNVVVHTANGDSNGVPFSVRPGTVYCVSTSGDDGNAGQFPHRCWRTLLHAARSMQPGDITYAEDGVTAKTPDHQQAGLSIEASGTPARPIALVAYPGAKVTIGTPTLRYGVRALKAPGRSADHWVLAGLLIKGVEAVGLSRVDGWRVVHNEMTCPNGSVPIGYGCVATNWTTHVSFLGNYVHDTGNHCGKGCKLYHGVYFSTDSNHLDVGWNTIIPRGGCRALQFHSTHGADQFDLHVHDNLIHDAICDGVNFASVDPSKGPVEAYNNVIYHVGTGPAPDGIESNYACVNVVGGLTYDPYVEIYNNTMFDCGSRLNESSGALSIRVPTRLRNNIIAAVHSEPYLTPSEGNCSLIRGANNLWFGAGAPPSCSNLTGNLNSDPFFVNAPLDFHLQIGSPAINSGVSISNLSTDFDGILRPQLAGYDLGAYEFLERRSGSNRNPCDRDCGKDSCAPISVAFAHGVVVGNLLQSRDDERLNCHG